MPNSINVAPARASSTIRSLVVCRFGSPAVMKGMKPFLPSRLSASNVSVIRLRKFYTEDTEEYKSEPNTISRSLFFLGFLCVLGGYFCSHGIDILVAAPRQIHDHDLIVRHLARNLHRMGDSVRGFKGWNDSFQF